MILENIRSPSEAHDHFLSSVVGNDFVVKFCKYYILNVFDDVIIVFSNSLATVFIFLGFGFVKPLCT